MIALPDDGPACKKCGRTMGVVADIAPVGNDPGLRAFLCVMDVARPVVFWFTRHIDPPRRTQPAKPANNNSSLSLRRMKVWNNTTKNWAIGSWHWSFMVQPEPFPERMIDRL